MSLNWLTEAETHILSHLCGGRISAVVANPCFGCVSVAVIREDEEFPEHVIQYVPPIKDLNEAAGLLRGFLVR